MRFLVLFFFVFYSSYSQKTKVLWGKKFPDTMISSFAQTSDGGMILSGSKIKIDNSSDFKGQNIDVYIIKISENGDVEWEKNIDNPLNIEIAKSIIQTKDGGYLLTGKLIRFTDKVKISDTREYFRDLYNIDNSDCLIIKISSLGEVEWEKSYGGSSIDWANSVIQTNDSGFVIAGQTYGDEQNDGDIQKHIGHIDFWILKLNEKGDLIWEKTYGGSGEDVAKCIKQTTDGGFIISGYTTSRNGDFSENKNFDGDWIYCAMKVSNSGKFEWQMSIGKTKQLYECDIVQTKDDGYIYTGTIDGAPTKALVVKLSSSGKVLWKKEYGNTYCSSNSLVSSDDGNFFIVGDSSSFIKGKQYYCWLVNFSTNGSILWDTFLEDTSIKFTRKIIRTKNNEYAILGTSRDSYVITKFIASYKK